mmetsp:Transcript_16024/g.40755  ORF Transcript_16024/g.40755 Transcript_16024/m.40755 type:complete len:105 (-) Transcript_16024:131-445(-)
MLMNACGAGNRFCCCSSSSSSSDLTCACVLIIDEHNTTTTTKPTILLIRSKLTKRSRNGDKKPDYHNQHQNHHQPKRDHKEAYPERATKHPITSMVDLRILGVC